MLRYYLKLAYEAVTPAGLNDKLVQRGTIAPGEKVDWLCFTRAMARLVLPLPATNRLLEMLYGTVPTPMWLWAHGWQCESICTLCNQQLDLEHCLQGCFQVGAEVTTKWKRAILEITPPPIEDVREGIFAFINGRPIPWEVFHFDEGAPIYTDGSAKHVRWPAIAVAASSAFQIDRAGVHRLLVAQLPAAYPISAVASEFFRLLYCNKGSAPRRF